MGQSNFTWRHFLEGLPFRPRPYQVEAISSWLRNDARGIFAMATGTGKTITAVSGVSYLTKTLNRQLKSTLTLVVCPYLHLVDQWAETLRKLGEAPIEACESRDLWDVPFFMAMKRMREVPGTSTVVVTTIATFSSDRFQEILRTEFGGEIVAVYDEAHNMGSGYLQQYLLKRAKYRLGLSATPSRWQDPVGTEALNEYFSGTVYEIDIKKAISMGILVPYDYKPVLCKMSVTETNAYLEISDQIGSILKGREFAELKEQETLRVGRLLRTRAQILGTISDKQSKFLSDFDASPRGSQLVYCSPGSSPTDESMGRHIEYVRNLLSKIGATTATYEATTPRHERKKILRRFESGEIEAVLSMRCLDEGVDIPHASVSYFIASGSNPREFVQRRGRVLRKYEGKEKATIFDYFAVPAAVSDSQMSDAQSILRRELDRAMEIADSAINRVEALEILKGVAVYAGVTIGE